MDIIIVSRHPAAIQFCAAHIADRENWNQYSIFSDKVEFYEGEEVYTVPIKSSVTPADVTGVEVYGNLPMNLAAVAGGLSVIEFGSNPPRGQEYTLADMEVAGAFIASYKVIPIR